MPATRAEAAQVPNKDKFEESIASKPFVFIIGQERKEFHIHKELIGQLSPVLNALVNGNMKEAREGRVEWLDLDVDTFVRFAKFAYSGNYTPAEPELLAPDDDALVLMRTPEEQDGKASTSESSEEEEDEDEEESLQDDDSVGSSGGSNAGEPIELSSDLEDGPDDPDQDTSEYSSPSEASSTLDSERARFLRWRPIDLSIDEDGVMHSRTSLPYSIENYMIEWDKCLSNRLLKHNMPLLKRRRYDTDFDQLSRLSPNPVNKKYEAMQMFFRPLRALNDDFPIPIPINEKPHESYLPVFLSHARLYILADKYGIERLRGLALGRLHETLARFVVHKARIADLVALAQEIFDNTMEMDKARTLIVDYFVCFIEDMQDSPELKEALIRGGEFPAMLVNKMALRRM